MQLYAITDRKSLGADERYRTDRLLNLVADWATGGVDYIQIREKDLEPIKLLELSRRIVELVRATSHFTRVLINGSPEMALEVDADGIHLPGGQKRGCIQETRRLWRGAGRVDEPVISAACHSTADVERARSEGADLVIFAPVFGKRLEAGEIAPGAGLAALKSACEAADGLPVFALGGVTADNADACISAGASGIAAIRLFGTGDWTFVRARS